MSTLNEQTETKTESSATAMDNAIVLDLGKKKRKQIKRLRKGRGKLIEQVESHLSELRAQGAMEESAQPVIVVVAEKPRDSRWL